MTLPLFAPPAKTVECEGCVETVDPFTLPIGWTATGTSVKRAGKLALWCRRCTEDGKSIAHVRQQLAEQGRRPRR